MFPDANCWTKNGEGNPYTTTTTCGTWGTMLGGASKLGRDDILQTRLTGLPSHTRLAFHFIFFVIDSWDDERFMVDVDGVEVYRSGEYRGKWGTSMCGLSGKHFKEYLVPTGVSWSMSLVRPSFGSERTSMSQLIMKLGECKTFA